MAEKWQALTAALRAAGVPFTQSEPLAPHTTFRIGGPAAVFCRPKTAEQLAAALCLCRQQGARYYLLGNGSNVLFADAGFDGCVLCTADLAAEPAFGAGGHVTAPAGLPLAALCKAAQQRGLTGLEFAYGIPGTVGGAVYMNAGAYLALGYRTSIFEKQPWCITQAVFALHPGDPAAVLERMRELLQRRKNKQPLDLPSAGSTFKRPAGAFAGKLIEDCGLRGFTVGGAQVSEKHCGFVVNAGGATCADVLALTEEVARIVYEKTGHTLEREIRVIE